MRARLTDDQIDTRLAQCPQWTREGDAIVRTVECLDFAAAIAFVVHVGFLAEAKDHHPDIDIRWRTVRLLLTTHDLGGLSEWDFELAGEIDAVAP
ncbi:MAG: 4a-hydroxytetrahydrobiopterin dehydratase [Acidimicrobiia bacterium]|nr:4a-hydroxytetrahydrobiopterin dehydratase [Acidimicrobiia bacterium]